MADKQFNPFPWSLKEVVENNFYEVPIYQRPYTWSNSEVDNLLDDIFSAYRTRADQPGQSTPSSLQQGRQLEANITKKEMDYSTICLCLATCSAVFTASMYLLRRSVRYFAKSLNITFGEPVSAYESKAL